MAYTRVDRFTVVKGCSVYAFDDNGNIGSRPVIDDAEVTLPSISHPTYSMNSMGTMDVVDQTRLDAMTCTISHDLGINTEQANSLIRGGVISCQICWAQEVRQANGLFTLQGFTAMVTGMVQSHGGNSLNIGDNPASDLTIQCYAYHLMQGEQTLIDVSQLTGKLVINGQDLREGINRLL